MYINKVNIFLVIVTFCFSFTTSFAYEVVFFSSGETIKELRKSIDVLGKEKIALETEFLELNTDYKLKSFLKKDLNRIDFLKIKEIVKIYNLNKEKVDVILISKSKKELIIINERKELLEIKRNFYNGLIPYIDTKYRKDYLDYIRKDAEIFNKQNLVSSNIITKKEQLDSKVTRIESEIIKHKKYIKGSIKKIIESRLDGKIKNLQNNETFSVLNNTSQIKVLDKTIRKIKIKLNNLEKSRNISNTGVILQKGSKILESKIQTYIIAVNKLESFKNSINIKK